MAFVNCGQFKKLKDNALTKEMLGEDVELKGDKLVLKTNEVEFVDANNEHLTTVLSKAKIEGGE